MRLTNEFITKTDRLKIQPEPHNSKWSKLNDQSPEMEVCEFLYSLVRLLRPGCVLETGGGTGNSSAYMAQGLKENKEGRITVLEPHPPSWLECLKLWKELEVEKYIDHYPLSSFEFNPDIERYDLMFLDSEPSCRFYEVKKFYPNLDPGGLILIHDLKWVPGEEWQDFREHIGLFLRNFQLVPVVFDTPRGLVVLQKPKPESAYHTFLKKIWKVEK